MVSNAVFIQSRWGRWEQSQTDSRGQALVGLGGPGVMMRGFQMGSQKTCCQIIDMICNNFTSRVVMSSAGCDWFVVLGVGAHFYRRSQVQGST